MVSRKINYCIYIRALFMWQYIHLYSGVASETAWQQIRPIKFVQLVHWLVYYKYTVKMHGINTKI
jgi:hypothetical protein